MVTKNKKTKHYKQTEVELFIACFQTIDRNSQLSLNLKDAYVREYTKSGGKLVWFNVLGDHTDSEQQMGFSKAIGIVCELIIDTIKESTHVILSKSETNDCNLIINLIKEVITRRKRDLKEHKKAKKSTKYGTHKFIIKRYEQFVHSLSKLISYDTTQPTLECYCNFGQKNISDILSTHLSTNSSSISTKEKVQKNNLSQDNSSSSGMDVAVSRKEFADLVSQVCELKQLVLTQKQYYGDAIKGLIRDVAEERKKVAVLQIEVDTLIKLSLIE